MRLLKILPGILLTLYITVGNMIAFRPFVMRLLSVIGILLLSLVALLLKQRGGLPATDWGFLAFMVIGGIAFWFFPQSLGRVIADFPTGVLYLILFFVVAVPAALMNLYFTEYYAKQTTPAAVWKTDIFKAINRHLTWLWAALFALSAFVTTIPRIFDLTGNLFTGLLFQIILPGMIMAGIGIPLNKNYPKYYQRKMGLEVEENPNVQETTTARQSENNDQQQKEGNMDNRLRVVAINGSPHGAVGNTSQMIQMIASALSQESIVVEEINLTDKRIEYCIGCAICLEKDRCWRPDDYAGVAEKLLNADAIILAAPVYFGHVTAQMKTFLDRSLAYGHKPRRTWKPGLAVSVSAGKGETETVNYLARMLGVYGAFSVGTFTTIATGPGSFLGKELVEARAQDLAHDLARAIKEKRRYPATDENLGAYLFMKELVTREKDFMEDDYQYWQTTGLFDGFETFVGQKFTQPNYDPALRKVWLQEVMQRDRQQGKDIRANGKGTESVKDDAVSGKASAKTCLKLISMMPSGFNKAAAQGLSAVYQFEITGQEEFRVYLKIEGGQCTFHEGTHGKPDVVVKSPADVWLAISRGEMNGQAAFMSGKYKIEGDIGLLMKLNNLFG